MIVRLHILLVSTFMAMLYIVKRVICQFRALIAPHTINHSTVPSSIVPIYSITYDASQIHTIPGRHPDTILIRQCLGDQGDKAAQAGTRHRDQARADSCKSLRVRGVALFRRWGELVGLKDLFTYVSIFSGFLIAVSNTRNFIPNFSDLLVLFGITNADTGGGISI